MKNEKSQYIRAYSAADRSYLILREKRIKQNMTQNQVAQNAKINLRQYQKFESGARSINTCSYVIACRVIEALGMDVAKFYHGEYAIGEEAYSKCGRVRRVISD